MDKPNFDGPEFQDVDGYNNTANASVPSAMTGRTGPAQNLGPGAANDLKNVKKKKRKTLAQRLAPKRLVRQTLTGVKGAADRVESMVRGDSWTRKHRARRESVDPVKMAADNAYRRRTKDLETLVSPELQPLTAAFTKTALTACRLRLHFSNFSLHAISCRSCKPDTAQNGTHSAAAYIS